MNNNELRAHRTEAVDREPAEPKDPAHPDYGPVRRLAGLAVTAVPGLQNQVQTLFSGGHGQSRRREVLVLAVRDALRANRGLRVLQQRFGTGIKVHRRRRGHAQREALGQGGLRAGPGPVGHLLRHARLGHAADHRAGNRGAAAEAVRESRPHLGEVLAAAARLRNGPGPVRQRARERLAAVLESGKDEPGRRAGRADGRVLVQHARLGQALPRDREHRQQREARRLLRGARREHVHRRAAGAERGDLQTNQSQNNRKRS